jgi:multimeric flavodoxin WrbA
MNLIKDSDGIIWAFPLYYMLVPSQYKRFIELIREKNAGICFQDKYTAAITTSINFYDHTAHNYQQSVCDDLNMKYVSGFSANMMDFRSNDKRDKLIKFAAHFFDTIKDKTATQKSFYPLRVNERQYIPGNCSSRQSTYGKKIIILTDARDTDHNLNNMTNHFRKCFSETIEIINLYDINIKGGCLGDLKCSYNNECQYGNSDGFVDFYDLKVKTADIIIFCGVIKDRYLSWKWKQYFDRSFYNSHKPTLKGKQAAFLISGPLSQIPNLKQIIEGYIGMQEANLAGIVTDESETSGETDSILEKMAGNLLNYANQNYFNPQTFLTVGGHKLFRDEIYEHLRFPFRTDHIYYKKNEYYDFPQKHHWNVFASFLMSKLYKIPAFRREVSKRMKKEMIKPLEKVFELN